MGSRNQYGYISQDTWKEASTEALLATNSNTRRKFKWKIITRFVFWLFPKLSVFCREVFDALKEVFQQDIPQDPLLALLAAIPKGLERGAKKYLSNILLTEALKCVTIRL